MPKLYKFSHHELALSDNGIVKEIKDRNWFEFAGSYEDSTKIADEFKRHRIHFEGVSNHGSYEDVAGNFFKKHLHLKKLLEHCYSQGPVQFLQNCIDVFMLDKFNLVGRNKTNKDVMSLVIRDGELYAEIVRSGITVTNPNTMSQYSMPGLMKAVFKLTKSDGYEGFQLQSIDTTTSLLSSILQGKTDQVDVKNPQVVEASHAEHEKVVKLKTLDGELPFSDVLTLVEFSDKRALPELFWEALHSPIQSKDIVTLIKAKANSNAYGAVSVVAMQKFNDLLAPNKYKTVEVKPRSAATVFRKEILKNDDVIDALTGSEIANLVKDDGVSAEESLKTTFWDWMLRQDVGRKYTAEDLKTLLLSQSREKVVAQIFKPKTTFFGLIQYQNYSDKFTANDLVDVLLKDSACDEYILSKANLRNRLLKADKQLLDNLYTKRPEIKKYLNMGNDEQPVADKSNNNELEKFAREIGIELSNYPTQKLKEAKEWFEDKDEPYTKDDVKFALKWDVLGKGRVSDGAFSYWLKYIDTVKSALKRGNFYIIAEEAKKEDECATPENFSKLFLEAFLENQMQGFDNLDKYHKVFIHACQKFGASLEKAENMLKEFHTNLQQLLKVESADQHAAWARLLGTSAKRNSQEDMSQKDGYVSDASDTSENSEASDLDDPATTNSDMQPPLPNVCSVEKYENENMSLPPVTPEKRRITSVERTDNTSKILPPVTPRYPTVSPNS